MHSICQQNFCCYSGSLQSVNDMKSQPSVHDLEPDFHEPEPPPQHHTTCSDEVGVRPG